MIYLALEFFAIRKVTLFKYPGKIDKPKRTVIPSDDELVEDDSSTPIAKPKKASDSKKKGSSDNTFFICTIGIFYC